MGILDIRIIHWIGARRKADAENFKGNNEQLHELIDKAKKWTPSNQPRHRGIMAVNATPMIMRLQLPSNERPSIPRLE